MSLALVTAACPNAVFTAEEEIQIAGAPRPIVAFLLDLIKEFGANLPAILEFLAAAGMILPPWASMLLQILIRVFPKPTPSDEPSLEATT